MTWRQCPPNHMHSAPPGEGLRCKCIPMSSRRMFAQETIVSTTSPGASLRCKRHPIAPRGASCAASVFLLLLCGVASSWRKFAPCATGAPAQVRAVRVLPRPHKTPCHINAKHCRTHTAYKHARLPRTDPWRKTTKHALIGKLHRVCSCMLSGARAKEHNKLHHQDNAIHKL